ncbi:MAG TPA: ComF family protein [Mycobacterium sp.]|nr:ComF family protein [Mycobacterium sp.]
MLDLVLPLECGGCGAPSTTWCDACAQELKLKTDDPRVITPRVDPGVPVFSLGRYAGARRAAIVAAKERGRGDLIGPLAFALQAGLNRLIEWGIVDAPLTLVPAPTRRSAARRRGGDPVTRIATAARVDGVHVVAALRMRAMTRDSVGLSTTARQANVVGRVKLRRAVGGDVILVDDIVTTGATATESVRILHSVGARVVGVLAIAHA